MKVKAKQEITYIKPKNRDQHKFYKINRYHQKAQGLVDSFIKGTEFEALGETHTHYLVDIEGAHEWLSKNEVEPI